MTCTLRTLLDCSPLEIAGSLAVGGIGALLIGLFIMAIKDLLS